MKRFADFTLAQKLRTLVMGVAVCLLFATSLISSLYSTYGSYQDSERFARTIARVIANNATAAMSFADSDGASEVLHALRSEPDVQAAMLVDVDSSIVARYGADRLGVPQMRSGESFVAARDWRKILIVEPVAQDDKRLGYAVVQYGLDKLHDQVMQNVLTMVALIFAMMIIAIPIARRLARSVAEPIEGLKGSMAAVSAQQDFSIRALKTSNDEVGYLVDQFNAMLDQLADRETKLEQHRLELEKQVADRTQTLQVTNSTLLATVEDLREAKDVAERASLAKGEFLANMSHEIRSPLNGVIGMAELMRKSGLSDRQTHFCRTILDSSKSLLTILNDILDFSKIEAGSLELEDLEFSVNELVEDTVQLFAEGAAKKKLELICHIDLSADLIVRSDPYRLRQILNNLVSNAIKFTEQGAVKVKLDERPLAAGRSVVRFSVIDTGVGMDAATLKRIFNAFEQADGSTSRRYGGTGLGLSISRQLATLLDGELGVESAVGKGCDFWLEVELDVVSRRPNREGFAWKGKRVLLVDENQYHLETLAAQLKDWGLVCETVGSTQEAFARVQGDHPPDLLLVDEEISDSFGLILLDQLADAQLALDVPKILMISITSLGERLVENPHLDQVLTKPIRPSDLFDSVNEVMNPASARESAGQDLPEALVQPSYAGFKALVAEDNIVNQEVAEELLREFGLDVIVVGDGQQALEHCRLERPDLVFMDCQMPVMDGYDATRAIRELEASTHVNPVVIVALTANALQGDRDRCMQAGMDDFLSKPFELEDLEAVLRKWLTPATTAASPQSAAAVTAPKRHGEVALDAAAIAKMQQIEAKKPGFVDRALTSLGTEISELRDLLGDGVPTTEAQWEAIRFVAHRLKSTTATLGATQLAADLRKLEMAAAGQIPEEFEAAGNGFLDASGATLRAVENALCGATDVEERTYLQDHMGEVLLADDDEFMRMLITETLEQAGYEVRCAVDGQEALDQLRQKTPDLLLLDMLMPRRNGFEVLTKLRSTRAGRHLPVVVMTGLDDSESIHKAFEAGATDFIMKPVASEVLVNRLRYILRAQSVAGELRMHQQRLRQAQDTAGVSFWEYDPAQDSFYLGDGLKKYLGIVSNAGVIAAAELRQHVNPEVVATIDNIRNPDNVENPIQEFTLPDSHGVQRHFMQHLEEVFDAETGERKIVGTMQDVTEIRDYEKHVYQLSHFDQATGLPNETYMTRSLDLLRRANQRFHEGLAFILVDAVEFQRVAPAPAEQHRTIVRQLMAERLQSFAQAQPSVCRLPDAEEQSEGSWKVAVFGAHRFGLLLVDVAAQRDVAALCDEMLEELARPMVIDGEEHFVTPCLGVAVAPQDGLELADLERHALTALTEQLGRGQTGFGWYSKEQDEAVHRRMSLERELRHAVSRGEIEAFYQPRVDALSLRPKSLEALARWRHGGELVSPVEFIPIAEETGLINDIGEYMLRESLRQMKEWQDRIYPELSVSVNVSGQQFTTSNLLQLIEQALVQTGVAAETLELEITEGVLIEHTDEVLHYLEQLRQLGVGLALDDFGTGYSSLSYLSRLPMNVLKIDRSFVMHVLNERRSQAIIRASVSLADELGIAVVAEGVETPEQLAWLQEAGCHELQGFYFAKPMPAAECETWLFEQLKLPPGETLHEGERKPV